DSLSRKRAAEAAEIEIRPQHVLHRKSKVFQVAVGADVDRFQKVHQRGPVVPRHFRALADDVVAFQGRNVQEVHVGQVETGSERLIVAPDLVVDLLRVVNNVHFVDRDDNVLDAEERNNEGMALGLDEDAVSGVDEDDGEVGGRSAGGHV